MLFLLTLVILPVDSIPIAVSAVLVNMSVIDLSVSRVVPTWFRAYASENVINEGIHIKWTALFRWQRFIVFGLSSYVL